MLWKVKYSRKGLVYVTVCILIMIFMFFSIPYPARIYQEIEVRHLHNEDLFYSLEQLVQDWTEPFITDIYVSQD